MESKADRKTSFLGDAKTDKKVFPTSAHDYELLQEIGRGGTATVYRAKCIPLNEYVAVKVLDLDRCFGTMDEVQKEAKTMSLINHLNVVKAHCSFVVEHFLWVVMPYMGCGSCLHIMKAAFPDGFEEPIIAYFLKETLKALEYLHQHGHIHRDVKAGNILVDSNGAIKLGDFGVSACMFDTGDRQRTRSTFIGTPCWMAPEVMEERPRYDYKADVWSFGITALELAHGHAPFSKYPPMKVLLMTLQNAPPGLDYERDRRFSKSFKEMVAMCLVKDPTKRPSGEKLLKHSFFKNAKPAEYVVRTILAPLPPLWQLVSDLQVKEQVRVAKKQIPYGEEEAKSQNEYKRGVSCWTFDLEDLKAQAALNETEPPSSKEGQQSVSVPKPDGVAAAAELNRASSPPSPQGSLQEPKSGQPQTRSDVDDGADAEEHVTRVGPRKSSPPPTGSKTPSDPKPVHPPTGKKEPKHFGRFDVFDDDPEPEVKDSCSDKGDKPREQKKDRVGQEDGGKTRGDGDDKDQSLDLKQPNERAFMESSSVECSASMQGEERVTHISTSHSNEDLTAVQPSKPKGSGGPLTSVAGMALDAQTSNGGAGLLRSTTGSDHKASKNVSEEKQKSQAVFQKKGRFSVTSQDTDSQQEASNTRKNASVQTSMPPPVLHKSATTMGDERKTAVTPASASPGVVSTAMVIPQLQNLFNQTAVQQELILNLMNSINPSDQHTVHRSSSFITRNASKGSSSSLAEPMGDLSAERERDLLAQVTELQCRVTTLVEELQAVKLRNGQLERQLNAIFNRDEEERIRREDAAKEDG